jgi:hypothetical protein
VFIEHLDKVSLEHGRSQQSNNAKVFTKHLYKVSLSWEHGRSQQSKIDPVVGARKLARADKH